MKVYKTEVIIFVLQLVHAIFLSCALVTWPSNLVASLWCLIVAAQLILLFLQVMAWMNEQQLYVSTETARIKVIAWFITAVIGCLWVWQQGVMSSYDLTATVLSFGATLLQLQVVSERFR